MGEDVKDDTAKLSIKAWGAKFIKQAARRKIQSFAKNNVLTIPGWRMLPERDPTAGGGEPRPSYELDSFQVLYPSAANQLPIRKAALDLINSQIKQAKLTEELGNFVKKHNAQWNPAGEAWDTPAGRKRKAADDDPNAEPRKAAKAIEAKDDCADMPALENKVGKVKKVKSQNQTLCFTTAGELWVWGDTDGVLTADEPLCLVWGEFKRNSEATAVLEKHLCARGAST